MANFEGVGKQTDFGPESLQVAGSLGNKLRMEDRSTIDSFLKTQGFVKRWGDSIQTGMFDFSGSIKSQSTDKVQPKALMNSLATSIDAQCKGEVDTVQNANLLASREEARALLSCIQGLVGKYTNENTLKNVLRTGNPDTQGINIGFDNLRNYR